MVVVVKLQPGIPEAHRNLREVLILVVVKDRSLKTL